MSLDRPEERKAPLILFYSYAHADEPLRNELEKHLSTLQRQGIIAGWHDRKIDAGSSWATDIDTYLNLASIILLLISPDFLASDYCYSIEMEQALKRHKKGEVLVILIILRPVYWQEGPLRDLQALPRDGRPITSWSNRDEAFFNVVQGIRVAVSKIQERSSLAVQRKASLEDSHSVAAPPERDRWEEGGAIGEYVGSLVRKEQWAQAEAAARQIADSRQRSLVLHKLVNTMIQSKQWARVEGVAFSIEDPEYKRQALAGLARKLIEAQQWERAKGIIYNIDHPSDRSLLLMQLSRASVDDEGLSRQAQIFAYDADQIRSNSPQYYRSPAGPPLARQRSSGSGCSLLLLAVLIVAPLLYLFLTRKLPDVFSFLLWGLVGVIAIYIIIKVISFIRDIWF